MKKWYSLLLFICLLQAQNMKLNPYSTTGHDQFSEIVFVEEGYDLLKDFDDLYIKMRLRGLPVRFWGYATEIKHEYVDATYVGSVVFSRSNHTEEAYVFDYTLTEVAYYERSFNIEGSLTLRGVIKEKKVEGQGTIDVKAKYGTKESSQTTERSAMKVTVYPGKKITLRVAGDAKVSCGFSKYYVFWICMQKGAWEAVDVVTSYFELVEEDV